LNSEEEKYYIIETASIIKLFVLWLFMIYESLIID